MKNSLFRFILKVHKKLPFVPFEKKLIKFYHNFQDKKGTVEVNMGGINYKLDLNELIDNKVFYGNWEPTITFMFKKIIKTGNGGFRRRSQYGVLYPPFSQTYERYRQNLCF